MACEVVGRAQGVGTRGRWRAVAGAVSAQNLAPGMVTPGLNHAHVVGREVLVAPLRDALYAVAGRSRDITG